MAGSPQQHQFLTRQERIERGANGLWDVRLPPDERAVCPPISNRQEAEQAAERVIDALDGADQPGPGETKVLQIAAALGWIDRNDLYPSGYGPDGMLTDEQRLMIWNVWLAAHGLPPMDP